MNAGPRPSARSQGSPQRHPWVIVPGIWDSDPDHWQSRWQAEPGVEAVRIAPTSWSDPDPADWSQALSRAVASASRPPVLVAHSLGVLAVTDWLVTHGDRVAGAFLVAPPDPDAPSFPAAAAGFRAPTVRVSTPTALVVSDDDRYCSADRATAFAAALGAEVLRVGARQHVNVASAVGRWDEGRQLLAAFEERC
ncbi:alpha/beta hydrolase [Curtobacterium flaccumfaciens pv. beticola]|uniref:RBBP9/YdeN family alpha/beta hydrolase n=1 Tax=Curtobacterium flaccumfaciens TaxID=2035 RepID=UPI00349F6E4C|nr:alpha/beta hydrolase [Curtobacterium flaccumfaciens pv. basellae]